MNIYCGVDWGSDGGFAFIDSNQSIIEMYKTPMIGKEYDLEAIKTKILYYKDNYNLKLMVEEVHFNPMMSGKSAVQSGYNNGVLIGLLYGLGISFEKVLAKHWQKEIFKGVVAGDTKSASIIYCKNKYPYQSFKRTEKCSNDDVGLTDAVCIANYCLVKNRV